MHVSFSIFCGSNIISRIGPKASIELYPRKETGLASSSAITAGTDIRRLTTPPATVSMKASSSSSLKRPSLAGSLGISHMPTAITRYSQFSQSPRRNWKRPIRSDTRPMTVEPKAAPKLIIKNQIPILDIVP